MPEPKLRDVPLGDIVVRGDRVTPLNEKAVAVIRQSVEETGEIRDPIHLRQAKGKLELIDGRHRLEVARELGFETISARVWACTLEQARLMEADANVTFTHMSPVEMAVSLAKRKEVYLKLHPETKQGTAGGIGRWGGVTEMSFADFLAEVVKVTPRQIQRVVAAGEALSSSDVCKLRSAPNRVAMNDLYQLAKINEDDERRYVIGALAGGNARNAAAARRSYKSGSAGATAPKDPVEEGFKALTTTWKRVPKAARVRFVEEHLGALADMVEAAQGGPAS